LLCGAQVAKSTAIQVGMAYRLVRATAPALWVLDTQTNAQSFSESRWQVMIDDNEVLRAQLPRNKDKFKNLDQAFARMHLWFIGSNSPGNLAGRSISLLCLDEVDKYRRRAACRPACRIFPDASDRDDQHPHDSGRLDLESMAGRRPTPLLVAMPALQRDDPAFVADDEVGR
jgi:hypothetical protein